MAKLYLLSSQPDDVQFAQAVASTAGLEFVQFSVATQLVDAVNSGGASVTFVDISQEGQFKQLEQAIQDSIGLFSDKINPNWMHFLTLSELGDLKAVVQSPLFGNLVVRQYGGSPADCGVFYGHLVKGMLSDRCFGLDKLLKSGTKVQSVKFQRTIQKQDAVEAVKNYCLAAKFKPRMAAQIANAVDELLMNAMFDAPVDEMGRQIYSMVPRSTDMALEGKRAVEMNVGYDGTYIAVSVTDHFGSLDKAILFNHISKSYADEEYKLKSSSASAGLGLATVFEKGGNFLFSAESGSRTEVTIFFRKTDSFKDFKGQFRFLGTQFYF